MPQATANGLQLEYETLGDPKGPPILLIMGLGAQLTRWPEGFCRALVEGGYYLIRFDNRDVGLSTKIEAQAKLTRTVLRAALRLSTSPPYTLDDMANDTRGLLDALQLPSVHVIGASMGGMIGQLLAARYGDRVRSFVSIMSTSGDLSLPRARIGLQLELMRPLPRHADREARIQRTMQILRLIGSAAYPHDEAELRAQVTRDFDRNYCIPGYKRQLAAIVGSPSRLHLLPSIKAKTLVIHGSDDPLVPVAAAYDLQRRIPGAQLEVYPGMGHELPVALQSRVVTRILSHLRTVSPS